MGAETKIYVIGTARGPKKVGLSKMPSRRCLALDNAGIRGLSVLYERRIALSLARQIEGHAHHLLRHALVHGEWFKATIAQAREAIDAAVACDGDGEQAKRNVGRDKQWEKRLTLPLTSEMVDRLDAAKRPGEDRLTVIRKGIERELKSRERQVQKDRADG